MKTDPKNQEPVQGLQFHPELASPNTNPHKRYEVTVYRTEYLWCTVHVDAIDEKDAKRIGNDLASDQDKWKTADAEQYIGDLKCLTEGGRNNE